MIETFDKLDQAQIDELAAFTGRDDLLVKGTDATPGPIYRGGCLPYILFSAAGFVAWLGPGYGLDKPMAYGLCAAMAMFGTLRVVRAFKAVRRARKLLERDEPWHALAWTAEEVCFRSFERCMLAPWSEVERIALLEGDDVNQILRDTLWIHLSSKERALIRPRDDVLFAGRALGDWETDLNAAWAASRGDG